MLQSEIDHVRRPRYLLSGWACRYRDLQDGQRQIFDFVLPGEGVGVYLRPQPIAMVDTLALTAVRMVEAGGLFTEDALADCSEIRMGVEAQAAADDRRLLDHVVRLGRLTALERVAHILLDLHERLLIIGEVSNGRFSFPVTQEQLADLAGLSVVHLNRTVQELRRQEMIWITRGSAQLSDTAALASAVGYTRDGLGQAH